ncbi:3-deoxy-7-phosphoheptulonate synthase [Brachyspira aalborgi]|jgi:3-deoxy-7-phosphoheptulonate synthase|uniref:3-deoxy-7-phosphoheptulonate synthase n=1 Tax=Brachyspira aalborgi TaxID=29522 RepID=A0A5C8G5G0_9SPIR|nr:3-deoxy-7-phosphoheptulonate synthase [Brachyspira aalborgi]TXJ57282.1 3-deoxy-7-phosphoheptulonate synthase [Brachyspira aalborgi]
MIIVMKPNTKEEHINSIIKRIENAGLKIDKSVGVDYTVIGVVGDTGKIDRELISSLPGVSKILKVQEPFKRANRAFKKEDTIVNVSGVKIGENKPVIIAGPCSVESEEQVINIAKSVKLAGASILRGGAFKPRTSPYAFQGLALDGLKILKLAKEEVGIPIVSEIVSIRHLEEFDNTVDMIQIGARNMQNFELLKEVGKLKKPILLKRGLANTMEEWLMSAEYILDKGNSDVVLCERGIRTFENYTRNTFDVSAIPMIKRVSHLPVIGDPSHASGKSWMALPLTLAALSAGADGMIIEVHNDPEHALCDGAQSIKPEVFADIMEAVNMISETVLKIKAKHNGRVYTK